MGRFLGLVPVLWTALLAAPCSPARADEDAAADCSHDGMQDRSSDAWTDECVSRRVPRGTWALG